MTIVEMKNVKWIDPQIYANLLNNCHSVSLSANISANIVNNNINDVNGNEFEYMLNDGVLTE